MKRIAGAIRAVVGETPTRRDNRSARSVYPGRAVKGLGDGRGGCGGVLRLPTDSRGSVERPPEVRQDPQRDKIDADQRLEAGHEPHPACRPQRVLPRLQSCDPGPDVEFAPAPPAQPRATASPPLRTPPVRLGPPVEPVM